jgi:CheY-like chemotaxis protein
MMVNADVSCNSPILVVDDDEDILKMTSYVLKNLGYAVKTADGGVQGIRAIEIDQVIPCLILLDLRMPVMDGSTFRKKLLNIPHAANVPIVILSGDSGLAKKASDLGVAGYEQKPISVERLAALAAKYCKLSN